MNAAQSATKTRWGGLGQAVFFTALFGLIAHGFRFFRLDFAHDATLVYQSDDVWQIRLGRYLMPLYARLRGQLVAPAWVGTLALGFLALAVWLVCRLLRLERPGAVALTAGLMATYSSFTFSNAAYLPWSDIYMLALLCAVGSVFLWRRSKWGFVPAMALLAVSLALYPSYIQATAFLMLAALAGDCLEESWDWKATLARGGRALAALVGGGLLYAAAYRAVLAALGLAPGAASNSVAHLADLAGADYPALLAGTYRACWEALVAPKTFRPTLAAGLNLLWPVSVVPALALALKGLSRKASRYVILAAALVLMPLGVGGIYFLTLGQTHALMTYPMILAPVAALALWERVAGGKTPRAWAVWGQRAMALALALLVFCAAAFSNQVYLKQALNADNTRSTLTRLLDRVEQVAGYRPGETPVALFGTLRDGPLAMFRPGFEDVTGTGLDESFCVTNYVSYDYYFEQVLGYPIELLTPQEAETYAQMPEVQTLEPFPAANCAVLLPDGTLAVRLS